MGWLCFILVSLVPLVFSYSTWNGQWQWRLDRRLSPVIESNQAGGRHFTMTGVCATPCKQHWWPPPYTIVHWTTYLCNTTTHHVLWWNQSQWSLHKETWHGGNRVLIHWLSDKISRAENFKTMFSNDRPWRLEGERTCDGQWQELHTASTR